MGNSLFSGLWQAGRNESYVWYDALWPDFLAKAKQLQAEGYSLNSLDVANEPDGGRWAGVWLQRPDPLQRLLAGLSLVELRSRSQAFAAAGLQMHCLRSYLERGVLRWAACWQPSAAASVVPDPMSWDDFWQAWLTHHAAGLRLVDFDVHADGAQWSGIWQPGSGEQHLWAGASWDGLAAKHAELRAQQYQLLAMRSYEMGGTRRWAAVWRTGLNDSSMVADLTETQLWSEWQRQREQGRCLARLHVWPGTGYAPGHAVTMQLRLHLKIVSPPTISIKRMLECMRLVYEPAGFAVDVGSIETLTDPGLVDIDVGDCSLSTTDEQARLFSNRNNIVDGDVVAYFVRSTLPPYNGCAAHPPNRPGAVIASYASEWTLGHEIGHVLGLFHVNDNRRLMTGLGTANIVEIPPDLVASEINIMAASGLLRP